jgi:hypothetical protein
MPKFLDGAGKSHGPTESGFIYNLLRNPSCSRFSFIMISGMMTLGLAERLFAFSHFCVSGSSACLTSMSQDRLWRARVCCLCSILLLNLRRSTINRHRRGTCISPHRLVTCISLRPRCTSFKLLAKSTIISHQQSGSSNRANSIRISEPLSRKLGHSPT